ncbi:hypothetical protein OYC64_006718 [Pagothenia borchgrevinki]|uniref:Uncharacterized protein n=1 Tax=Pagothenia borchgrevinki TaxID=8213 RepID=A0ABD2GL03_PAGBO
MDKSVRSAERDRTSRSSISFIITFITITIIFISFITSTFIMMSRLLLLVLSAQLTSALCSDWLSDYSTQSGEALNWINSMGGPLRDERPVPFPNRAYRRIRRETVQSQLAFVGETLSFIAQLFNNANMSAAGWNQTSTEKFRTNINRQREDVLHCIPSNTSAVTTLRKYFRMLEKVTLLRTGGSRGSWEQVRWETRAHLVQLDVLVQPNIKNQSARRRRHHP